MQGLSLLAGLATIGFAVGQGVTDKISPKESAPAGCKPSFDGLFQVTVEDVTLSTGKKRDLANLRKREGCAADGTLVVGLAGGVLTDAKSRTGYIASNRQFQFDGPPQAGAIFTAGFSVCGNSSLALGGSTVWYQCASGDFYNLYDKHWAPQCSPVEIVALPCGGPDPPFVGQIPDGQIVGTTVVATTVVVPLSDGQPQVITTQVPVPICQISDGQVQGKTTPCASITPVTKPTPAPVPVSQYSDGQIQVTPPGVPPPPATATPATTAPTSAGAPPPPVSTAPKPPTPSSGANTTLGTSSKSTAVAPPSSASTAATPAPSAPANSAAKIQMSSVAALVVGILGAVWFL